MLCGSRDCAPAGTVESHGAKFSYVLCRQCGLKYMNPRPTAAWYAAHYGEHFWEYKQANRSWRDSDRQWRVQDLFKRDKSGRQRHQSKRIAILEPLLRRHSKLGRGRKLLDIGCAYGAIGAGLREAFGCEVWGVEPNATARQVAQEENGIQILANEAEDILSLDPAGKRFDVILMSNVLENILDPLPILAACRALLSDDGMMCVHTPDFFFYDAMNPYHPYIYSADTLSALLSKAGHGIVARDCAPTASERNSGGPPPSRADRFVTVFAGPKGDPFDMPNNVDAAKMAQEQAKSLALQEALVQMRNRGVRGMVRRLLK